MDFDSLTRRDLQFLCKRNKIPANITNIAMADALKSLEIVEGIDEFKNRSESTFELSPTSVAKAAASAARTAARTTRRKTKEETQSSDLVTRSCYVTRKSLSEEMDQENINTTNVPQSRGRRVVAAASIAVNLESNVCKTPAIRCTRRGKEAVSVQRVYSTRRSVKLLEESMADLSLMTKESVNLPVKMNDDAESEKSTPGSKSEEAEVISVRDLNDSLDVEWYGSKSDPDLDILYGDLGDITFCDAKTSEKQMTGIESNTDIASDSFVLVKEVQETMKEDEFIVVDHLASSTTNFVVCNKESQSEQMKNDSESETEETDFGTDPLENDDSGVSVDTNQEILVSETSASVDVSKVDSVTTGLIADGSKELESDSDAEESKPAEEEICEFGELTDNEIEVALVSDNKNKAQAESDSDGWSSDFEISSYAFEDLIHTEAEEEGPVSEKMAQAAASSLTVAGKETETPSKSPFKSKEAPVSESDMNKENVEVEEMVLNNNGEVKSEAGAKKKTKKNKKKKIINEESFKDVSMRQLTKMVKELALKSKQQHMSSE
ncbi:unnamed protein product [Cochlearia groenlandica]